MEDMKLEARYMREIMDSGECPGRHDFLVSSPLWSSTPLATGKVRDEALFIKENDGVKILGYAAVAIPEEAIRCETEFINKTRETYLNIFGECNIVELEFKNKLNIHLFIDTDVYDKWDMSVEDGLVIVKLYEKKNKQPEFERVKRSCED